MSKLELSLNMTQAESLSQETEISLFEKINPKIKQTLQSQGIVSPTAIQEKSYEPILQGLDIIAQSRTGSGKTIAFGLGAFTKLGKAGTSKNPRLLVLTPTRELAEQIGRVFNDTFGVLGFQTLAITGGNSYHFQKSRLSKGVDAIVATPGRFCDLMDQKSFSLSELEILVLDEMDEMLDFGFSEDILRIKTAINRKVQTLLFSATFPQKVEAIVRQMTQNPVKITVSPKDTSTGQIEHEFIEVRRDRSVDALVGLLLYYNPEHAIIFCRTREETKNVSTMLSERGFAASVLNGEMGQRDRSETMNRFKQKNIRLLIATDVAARGIDVSGLSHVINLNVPTNTDTYTHRAGRTGRAGATGKSWTIVAYNQRREYQFICSKLKITPVRLELPNPKKILPKLLQNKLTEFKEKATKTSKTIQKAVEYYISGVTPESALDLLKDMLMNEMESMAGNFADADDIVPREQTDFGANVHHHHRETSRETRDSRRGSERAPRFFKEKRFSDTRKPYDKYESSNRGNKFKSKQQNPRGSQRSGRSASTWMG